ncbi:hypothetical protein VV01_18990 [Luteipulveratus halotolerans]|uniref:Uncharacterized protein n=1 Tax=Luteipulveratus halotolerans TaxID=1631356 RepID=A0A0L6CMH9_9MICO|nr:hypothetical protein VV01_18990 [Luteipulveratus halotolerans]
MRDLLSSLPDPGPMPDDVMARVQSALAQEQASRAGTTPGRVDAEDDPTGVREVLSSLPDPGPMPDDVMARIQSALAQEQASRAGTPSDNVTPLIGRRTSETASADGASPVSDTSRGRRRWLAPVAGLGAAAAIAVGALGVSQAMKSDSDDPPPAAQPPAATQSNGSSNPFDKVSIQNSGRSYTAAGLATEAVALKSQTGSIDPTRAESVALGPIATAPGLLDCLKVGSSALTADHISADLGSYEGKPAVIVVITDKGKSNAWVFSRQCTQGQGKIAGPTQLA